MKTKFLTVGIVVLAVSSTLIMLGLVAVQELNHQGKTNIFPDDWNDNPVTVNVFAWMTIILIHVSILGISLILYGLLGKHARQISVAVGVVLLDALVIVTTLGYPYT